MKAHKKPPLSEVGAPPPSLLLPEGVVQGISTFLDFLMEAILHIIIFLVPLLFTATTVENFLTPKEYIIRGGAHFFLLFYAIKVFLTGRMRISMDPVLKIFYLGVAYAALSFIWSVNFHCSVRDVRDFLIVILLAVTIRNNWTNRGFYSRILLTSLFSVFLVALLAWMQAHNSFVYFQNQLQINPLTLASSQTILTLNPNESPLPLGTFLEYFWATLFPQPGQYTLDSLISDQYGKTYWELFKFSIRSTLHGFNWTTPNVSGIISTFGNRNYLASFIAMMTFPIFSIWFFFTTNWLNLVEKKVQTLFPSFLIPQQLQKFINIIFLITTTLVILLFEYSVLATRSRGGTVALLVGFCFYLGLFVAAFPRWDVLERTLFRGAILIGGFFLLLFFNFFPNPLSIHKDSLGRKFQMIGNVETYNSAISNTLERLNVLRYTAITLTESPFKLLFGVGFGSFRHVFPLTYAKYMPEKIKATFSEVTFRQAHNDNLQLLQEFGLIGFAIFFALSVLVFRQSFQLLFKLSCDSEEDLQKKLYFLGLFSALFSYMLVLNFDFSHHQIANGFYGLLLFIIISQILATDFFATPAAEYTVTLAHPTLRSILFTDHVPLNLHLVFLATIFAAFSYRAEDNRWQADVSLKTATTLLESRRAEDALGHVRDSLKRDPLLGDGWYRLSTALPATPEKSKEIEEALERGWTNINYNGRATYHSILYQKVLKEHFTGNNREAIKFAHAGLYYTCGMARSPYHLLLGKIHGDLNELASATPHLEMAAKDGAAGQQASLLLLNVRAREQKWEQGASLALALENSPVTHQNPGFFNVGGISLFNFGVLLASGTPNATQIERATRLKNKGLEFLKKSTQLMPANYLALRDFGIALAKDGKLPEAKEAFEKMLQLREVPLNYQQECRAFLADCERILTPPPPPPPQGATFSTPLPASGGSAIAAPPPPNGPKVLLIAFEEEGTIGVLDLREKKFLQTLKSNFVVDELLVNPATRDIMVLNLQNSLLNLLSSTTFEPSMPIQWPAQLKIQDLTFRESGEMVFLANIATPTETVETQIFEIDRKFQQIADRSGMVNFRASRVLTSNHHPDDLFVINPRTILRLDIKKKEVKAQNFLPESCEHFAINQPFRKILAMTAPRPGEPPSLNIFELDNLQLIDHVKLDSAKAISAIEVFQTNGDVLLVDREDKKIHLFDMGTKKITRSIVTPDSPDGVKIYDRYFWGIANAHQKKIAITNETTGQTEVISTKLTPRRFLFLR